MPDPARRHAVPLTRPAAALAPGMLVAIVVAVLIIVGIGVVASLSGGPATTNADDDLPDAPDITELGPETARGMFIQLVDENDPTRVAGEIRAESFDPIDESNREVVEPRAWFFLDDGRTAYLEADEGRFFIPAGATQPEEGVLRGGVRVRLFDPQPNAARPDPESDRAAIDATFDDQLRFDLRLGELSTPGRVHVTGDVVEFVGTDVRAVLNEARGRITLLEVERGERLVYTPATTKAHARPTAQATFRRTATASPVAPVRLAQPDEPVIDLYRAVFFDGVVATQLGREIKADRLDVWVRLFDRQLPERARPATAFRGTPLDVILQTALALQQPEPPSADANAPITLTWTGRLRLDSLDEQAPPPELTGEDLALRFTAERSGLVTFADADSQATGTAVAAEYADTAQRLTLRGTAGTVRLDSPNAGRIEGVSQMAVAFGLGNVNVRGPGVLYAADHDDTDNRRAIRWTEQADFEFALVDGAITDRLIEARFLGRVAAQADAAEINGSAITARFVPDPTASLTESDLPPSRLDTLIVTQADARDGRGGSLRGDTMSVAFDPTSRVSDAEPTRVFVEGSVRGQRDDGASINSDTLDAELARDADERIIVASVQANGSVAFTDGRDVSATTSQLSALPPEERATLTGPDSTVRRGRSTITGPTIQLDGADRTLNVRGPGTLTDDQPESPDAARRSIDLAWQSSLAFDDRAGEVTVNGGITGRIESVDDEGVLAIDRVTGDRVTVELAPIDPDDDRDADLADGSTGDRVRTATVFANPRNELARVEARRYAPPPPAAADTDERGELLRVVALDGREIRLVADEQRVVVPGPGQLVSLQGADASADPDDAITAPSRVLVEWIGGMTLDRSLASADLFNRVAVVHYREDTDTTTELETERLNLTFRERENAQGELVALDAVGATWVRSGPRELLADRVLYNADTGLAQATATDGNAVTLFEGELGVPVRASELEWDLFRDRITITRPTGVTTPR